MSSLSTAPYGEYASLVSGGGVNVVGFHAGDLVALSPRR